MNPYRHAAALVLDRLKWDLSPLSWRSRARMRQWHNRYAGQRAIIVCNGPSLKSVDMSQLNSVFTIGLNKINLLFDRTDWRPSCIVAMNDLVLEQNAPFYNETSIPLFLSSTARSLIAFRPNVVFVHPTEQDKVARDCSVSLNTGYTVTVAALQLAFHFGFARVGIIGCDHNFQAKGPANAAVESGAKDESHFDPRYFSGGVKWQLPDLPGSEYFYYRCLEMFRAHGRQIHNCTDGGKLEIFPREDLKSWLASSEAGG